MKSIDPLREGTEGARHDEICRKEEDKSEIDYSQQLNDDLSQLPGMRNQVKGGMNPYGKGSPYIQLSDPSMCNNKDSPNLCNPSVDGGNQEKVNNPCIEMNPYSHMRVIELGSGHQTPTKHSNLKESLKRPHDLEKQGT